MAHHSHREFSKALVKGLLEQSAHLKWSVQGLGMLRLYLSTEMRLHLWHSSLRVPEVTEVHDHPWHFHSLVIVGRVKNERFFPSSAQPGDEWDYDNQFLGGPELYVKQQLLCGPGACTMSDPEDVILHKGLKASETCFPGDCYSQSKDQIHYTNAEDCTVTLVERKFEGDRDHANIYRRGGLPFVSAEPRPATREEVDLVVGETLRRWFSEEVGV